MGHPVIQQPSRECPYNHDRHGVSGQGCRKGCSCQCMFCLNVRATAEAERRAHCPTGDDARETCPIGCRCGCKTCTERRAAPKSACPHNHHVFMNMPAAACPFAERCVCECDYCVRSKPAPAARECPLGHDEEGGTHVDCPVGECSCNCQFCVHVALAAKSSVCSRCPFGHEKRPCNKSCGCQCETCSQRRKYADFMEGRLCPAGHKGTDGRHLCHSGFTTSECKCECKFCEKAKEEAAGIRLTGVDLPCPSAHDQKNTWGCREGCLCQCRHCVAYTRYLRFVREICPGGHARLDGSHDGVSPPPGCQCKCQFCENKRAGYACPFRHDSLLAPGTASHECSCFCTFCVSHRNGGPPAMNESPNKIVHPGPKLVHGSGRRTVTVSGTGQWPLHVAPNLYEGEVCRVQKVTGGSITLEVVGDVAELPKGAGHTVTVTPGLTAMMPKEPFLAFTPGLMVGQVARVVSFGEEGLVLQIIGATPPQQQKPLPPPINHVVMPRLTPLQVAQLLSHLDAFVQASLPGLTEPFTVNRQPFDAATILNLAAQPPLACEDYRRHGIGTAASGIIDILCGTGPNEPHADGLLFDVRWVVPSGARRMARLRRRIGEDAVAFARVRSPKGAEFAFGPAAPLPMWNVSFAHGQGGGTDIETVVARDATEAVAAVHARWPSCEGFSARLVADNDA